MPLAITGADDWRRPVSLPPPGCQELLRLTAGYIWRRSIARAWLARALESAPDA